MSQKTIEIFQNRITNVIDIHAKAEDLTNAEIIGVLELIKLDLYMQIIEDDESEDE